MVPFKSIKLDKKEIEKNIEELKKGNIKAIEILYKSTSSSIYSFALSILKNANNAEDILQEVYIKIYQNADKYKSKGNPMAWIIEITKNLCYMEIRKRKDTCDINEIIDILPDNKRMNIEDRVFLYNIFNLLSNEERQIITLHIISGFKHREISKILDIPLSTTLSKYNRALKKIRNKMEEGVN